MDDGVLVEVVEVGQEAHWCTFGLPGAVLEIGISSGSPSACRYGQAGSPLDGPYETSRTVGAGRPGRTTG